MIINVQMTHKSVKNKNPSLDHYNTMALAYNGNFQKQKPYLLAAKIHNLNSNVLFLIIQTILISKKDNPTDLT